MAKKTVGEYLKYGVLALVSLFLCYFGLTNLIMGFDLHYANGIQNVGVVLTRHSWLPLAHVFNSLMGVQKLDAVNFGAFLYVIVLFFKGLGLLEWLYIVAITLTTWLYCQKEDATNRWIFFTLVVINGLFVIELAISVFYALRSFLYVNMSVYAVLGGISLLYIIVGALAILAGLVALLILYRRFSHS